MKYAISQRIIPFELNLAHPLMHGLVYASLGYGYGTNKAEDSSLYKNHASLSGVDGSDWLVSSVLCRPILYLQEADCHVVTAPYTPAFYDENNMAVALWISVQNVNYSAYAGNVYLASQWDFAASKRTWAVQIVQANPGTLSFAASSNGVSNATGAGTTEVTALWQHYVFNIRSRRYCDVYKDGVFRETIDAGRQFSDQGSFFEYGTITGVNNRGARGWFSDVMMWSGRLLSTDEIAILSDPNKSDLGGLLQIPNRWLYAPGLIPGITFQQRVGRRTGIGGFVGGRR